MVVTLNSFTLQVFAIWKKAFLLIALIGLSQCNSKKAGPKLFENNNSRAVMQNLAKLPSNHSNKPIEKAEQLVFINRRYLNKKPIAELINMPVYSDLSTPFKLQKDSKVQIYAVGEMINALARVNKKYFFGNDDLGFYFDLRKDRTTFNKYTDDRQYIFTWVEDYIGGVNSLKGNVTVKKEMDSLHNRTIFLITFPWKDLGYIIPKKDVQIGFDFAASDNDDGIRQKGKIAWQSTKDSMTQVTQNYGTLYLGSSSNHTQTPGVIYSLYKASNQFNWDSIEPNEANNVIAGEIKDKFDCSALIKSCWDKKNLYFQVQVSDVVYYYKQRYITKKKRKILKTFCDYGWIENEKGDIVWEMNVLNSSHAGGALKNQKTDTSIYLKAGTYTLRYLSDESHSYNNWDDDPPLTPFYGIFLYHAN
jgi:hypothetical protein